MVIEKESSGRPWNEKLMELLAQTFPQFNFPEIQYEEKTEENGSLSCNARVKLLGQSFSSGPQASKEEALEIVSSLAFEVVSEFKRLILSETDASLKCEALSSLFRPVKHEAVKVASTPTQEALCSVTAIKNRLIEVENEKINLKVKSKSEKILEKMQGSVQMEVPDAVKSSKVDEQETVCKRIEAESVTAEAVRSIPVQSPVPMTPKSANPELAPISLSPLNIEEASVSKPKERKTNLGAPIPAFYEYVEKQSSKDPINFDDFVKGQHFGCRLRWGKKFWVAPAEHRQKKDAHNYAAVMACVESFGDGFTFEGVDPRIYFKWTRESVRQASDKYSFGLSDELLEEGSVKQSDLIDVSKIKIEPLPDGRKFTSVINEICQKMRFTAPNYQVASVNALTNYYVCTVRNFQDLPVVESSPFTKKNEAKEDVAGRIYYLLEQNGIVDEASRIIGRQKISDVPPPRPVSSNSPPLQTPLPPGMSSMPSSNFNMMQMMPMFMMAQMSQQQQNSGINPQMGFDPQMIQSLDGLMRQWQAFLAWQQQQQQSGQISVPNTQPQPLSPSQPPPPQLPPQESHNNYKASTSHQQYNSQRYHNNPPRQSDNYPNPRKRNYEESRRRYYDQ